MTKPHIAVVGAGIVGICTAYFLSKSGFKVTLIIRNDPGTMTRYGHACTFADTPLVP
jgi:Glycine/D-amino acid oxidases (deaminating)